MQFRFILYTQTLWIQLSHLLKFRRKILNLVNWSLFDWDNRMKRASDKSKKWLLRFQTLYVIPLLENKISKMPNHLPSVRFSNDLLQVSYHSCRQWLLRLSLIDSHSQQGFNEVCKVQSNWNLSLNSHLNSVVCPLLLRIQSISSYLWREWLVVYAWDVKEVSEVFFICDPNVWKKRIELIPPNILQRI